MTPRVTEEFLCTPKIFLSDKLILLLGPDSYQVYPSALHPRKLCPGDTLINLITLSCSHRRAFQDWTESTPGNAQLSPDRRNSRQSSCVPGLPRKGAFDDLARVQPLSSNPEAHHRLLQRCGQHLQSPGAVELLTKGQVVPTLGAV